MSTTQHFDYIVIGGGSGGYAAARTAREVCDKVAIIDSAKELGGLCILRGCMPSKTLIYLAEVLHLDKSPGHPGKFLRSVSRVFGSDVRSIRQIKCATLAWVAARGWRHCTGM